MSRCLPDQWRDKAHNRSHRFGASSETIEQLQLALEASGISIAKMTAKLRLPDEEPKDKPKRRARHWA